MTIAELRKELTKIDNELALLRRERRDQLDEWGYPTERASQGFEGRIHTFFRDLDVYSGYMDFREDYRALRFEARRIFLHNLQSVLPTGPFVDERDRKLHLAQLVWFAKAQKAPEALRSDRSWSLIEIENGFVKAKTELNSCDAIFVKLVEDVFYPLFVRHIRSSFLTDYYDADLPTFFLSVEAALIVMNSPTIGLGGAYYDWLVKRKQEFAGFIKDYEGRYREEATKRNLEAYRGRFASHDIVLNNPRVQVKAATAQIRPNRNAAIVLLKGLEYRLRHTERPFWDTLSLYYRQWRCGTPRWDEPSTPERARADAAAVLAEELELLMKTHGRDDDVVKLAQPLIERLHAPSSAISFRDVRGWEKRADADVEMKRGRDKEDLYGYDGKKKPRGTKSFIAFALAASDDGLAIEAPAFVAATGRFLPRGGSVVDAAFAAHARARARAKGGGREGPTGVCACVTRVI